MAISVLLNTDTFATWFNRTNTLITEVNLLTDGTISPTIGGGTIDGTPIGSSVPSTGSFTTISLVSPVSIANGGTGATNAGDARANLGVSNAANLTTGVVPQARLSGTYNIDISGSAASFSGTVGVANGGTGASTSSGARTNLEAVTSPAVTVDNALPRFSGVSGRNLQLSGIAVDDSDNMVGVAIVGDDLNTMTYVPSGTTAQRPGTPSGPGIRHNTTLGNVFEGYNGTSWQKLNRPDPWDLRTANYTAGAYEKILASTSGGVWTLTLPATPTTGQYVEVADATGDFGTNNLTVSGNGTNIVGSATYTANTNNAKLMFIYNGTEWRVF